MKFKKVSITAIITVAILIAIIIYFCLSSFYSSLGHKSTFADQNITQNRLTVIIDAGHGGIDPGAVSGAIAEKDLNLAVANKLADVLRLANVNVIMTRSEDILLGDGNTVRLHKTADLKERLKVMNETDNSIFISIHMNKFEMQSVHGLQTFYASGVEGSDRLAEYIQRAVVLIDPENKRAIKPDDKNIFILEKATKTAVLVECGFISNPSEAEKLCNDEYQNKLAFVIYTGIISYLQENNV